MVEAVVDRAPAPVPQDEASKLFTACTSPSWLMPPPCNQLEVLALPALTSSRYPRAK
jgi:hypothetical protein